MVTPDTFQNTPPHRALAAQCEALRDALVRNAWEEAETLAKALLPLIEADRVASAQSALDDDDRRAALLAAQKALAESRHHLDPAYHSLRKLLTAWNVLRTDS